MTASDLRPRPVTTWTCPDCGVVAWGCQEQHDYWNTIHNCKGDGMNTTLTPTQLAIQRAQERIAHEQERLQKMVQAEEEATQLRENLAMAFKEGSTVADLAGVFGLSENAVRSRLVEAGVITVKRRQLSDEEKAEALSMISGGATLAHVSDELGVAESVIRRAAREAGLIGAGGKRTDEEMEQLVVLENQIRVTYGTGFGGLAEALRKYRKRKAEAAGPVTAGLSTNTNAAVGTISATAGGVPIDVTGSVVNASETGEPVVLSPEDEAAMSEPDSQPWED